MLPHDQFQATKSEVTELGRNAKKSALVSWYEPASAYQWVGVQWNKEQFFEIARAQEVHHSSTALKH